MKNQAIALIFSTGINFLVNFAMNPFLARLLSYQDNATYGQLNLMNGYLTLIFGLGMASVINLLLAENNGKENTLFSTIFLIQCFSGILCISVLFLSYNQLSILFNNNELGKYVLLFLPSTFFIILSFLFPYYYIYFNKTSKLSIIIVVTNVIKIAGVLYAINILDSLFYVIVFLNLTNALILIIFVWGLRKEIFPLVKPHLLNIKYIINLSYPYLGMSIIGYSILFAGGIIVSNQLGVEEYAIYRNGAIEIPFFASLYVSITSVAMPKIVKLTNEGKIAELMVLKRQISNTVAALIYPVVFFCIVNGNVFMELYLGNKYIGSGIIFSIYNIVLLFRINSYSDILTIRKRPQKILIPNIIALAVSLVGTFTLSYFLGIKGAAIAFIASMILLLILLIYNSCKEIEINIYQYFDYNKLGKIALISLLFSIISFLFLKPEFLSFLGISTLYFTVVYIYIFKLDLVDRNLIPAKIQRIIAKLNFKWSIG